jgi:hypothetical protein
MVPGTGDVCQAGWQWAWNMEKEHRRAILLSSVLNDFRLVQFDLSVL